MYVYRNIYLQTDVAAHSVYAVAIRCVNIFQTAEVTLIYLIEKVLARQCQFYTVVPHQMQVYASRQIHQSIVWRCSLRVISREVMILSQVILHSCRKVCPATMAVGKIGEVITHVKVPSWCRHHWQPL